MATEPAEHRPPRDRIALARSVAACHRPRAHAVLRRRTACGRGCTACAHGVERLCGARAPITITTPNGSRALLRTACSASHTCPGAADRRGQASTPSSMLLLPSAARALAQSGHRSGLARRTPLRPLPPAQRRSAPRDAPVSQIRGDGHSAHSTVWPVAAHASPARQRSQAPQRAPARRCRGRPRRRPVRAPYSEALPRRPRVHPTPRRPHAVHTDPMASPAWHQATGTGAGALVPYFKTRAGCWTPGLPGAALRATPRSPGHTRSSLTAPASARVRAVTALSRRHAQREGSAEVAGASECPGRFGACARAAPRPARQDYCGGVE